MKTIAPGKWRSQSAAQRLDSDREALPFPAGGVLALKATPTRSTPSQPVQSDDLAGRLIASIDLMQARLDQLQNLLNEDMEADLDAIAGHIGRASDDWSPSAA